MLLSRVQLSPVEKYKPLVAQVRARRERFLFMEIVDFLSLGISVAAMGGGGAQRPVGRGKDGCAHARPKPTSISILAVLGGDYGDINGGGAGVDHQLTADSTRSIL